jgi:hypothetical protein
MHTNSLKQQIKKTKIIVIVMLKSRRYCEQRPKDVQRNLSAREIEELIKLENR